MAQVSKKVLSEKEWRIMWKRFLDVFVRSKDRGSFHTIFKGLLTPTEKVILAKRIVAGFLIVSDWEAVDIAKALKLSISTVYKYVGYLERNRQYRKLLKKMLPEKIPLDEFKVGVSGTPALVKLLDNIFKGYRKRSKLMYG